MLLVRALECSLFAIEVVSYRFNSRWNWPLTMTSYSTTRTTRRLVDEVARQVSRLTAWSRLHPVTSIPSIETIRSPARIVPSLKQTFHLESSRSRQPVVKIRENTGERCSWALKNCWRAFPGPTQPLVVRAGWEGPLQLTVGPEISSEFLGPQIFTLTTADNTVAEILFRPVVFVRLTITRLR